MITRDFGQDWKAGCEGAPPPLHVTDDNPQANWHPLPERPAMVPQHPGPVLVMIPTPAPYGDDPTDPIAQTEPRMGTDGMVGRLNFNASTGTVHAAGVRP